MRLLGYILGAILSAVLLYVSALHKVELDFSEAAAVVTGAWCVWLTVKENIWNWPIGIVSSAAFFVLFLKDKLYGDMWLQAIYVVLGFLGWYWWLRGGKDKAELHVEPTPKSTAVALTIALILSTAGMDIYLTRIKDTAPFLDALTTALSLVAQFMLTKKLIENWYVWITADIIYVGLYAYKHLYLSAVLYAVFIAMCVAGLRDWRASMARTADVDREAVHA